MVWVQGGGPAAEGAGVWVERRWWISAVLGGSLVEAVVVEVIWGRSGMSVEPLERLDGRRGRHYEILRANPISTPLLEGCLIS